MVGQVGIRRDQTDDLFRAKEVGDALLLIVDSPPGRHWVVGVKLASAVDEILIVHQRHLGVLRGGVVGVQGDAPVHLASGRAREEALVQFALCLLAQGDLPRVGAAQPLRIRVGPQIQGCIDLFDLPAIDLGYEANLIVGAVFVEQLIGLFERDTHQRVRAHQQRLAVDLAHQRGGERRRADLNELALFKRQGVAHEYARQLRHTGIGHNSSPP